MLALLLLARPLSSPAQAPDSTAVLSIAPVAKVHAQRGKPFDQALALELRAGYHVNSNAPDDEFLIPLRLTWNSGPLEAKEIRYPKPERAKFSFSEKPVAIFSGKFEIVTRFVTSPNAADMGIVTGKLRYQACNDRECLQPKTVDVRFSVEVH